MKIVIGDINVQVGREVSIGLVIGSNSVHVVSNDNGQRGVNFAAIVGMGVDLSIFISL